MSWPGPPSKPETRSYTSRPAGSKRVLASGGRGGVVVGGILGWPRGRTAYLRGWCVRAGGSPVLVSGDLQGAHNDATARPEVAHRRKCRAGRHYFGVSGATAGVGRARLFLLLPWSIAQRGESSPRLPY